MRTIVLAGTKTKSIARNIGSYFQREGWSVWLYSRTAKHIDRENWHERRCDITSFRNINHLLNEIPHVNVVVMSADSGTGYKNLDALNEEAIRSCIDVKLVGSVLITQALLAKSPNRSEKVQLIWLAGKLTHKPADLFLYGVINSGIAGLVEELNFRFPLQVEAYYLPTGLISPSSLGDAFIKQNPVLHFKTEPPENIAKTVAEIIAHHHPPGILPGANTIL